MILRWSQIMTVACFANIVCCGIVKSSKEGPMNIFKMPEMNEIGGTADICPTENSNVPVFLPHSDDCNKFYICDNGTPYLKSCHPGLHFNPKINSCDYPKNVRCDKKVSAKENGRVAKEKMDICPPENSEVPVHLAHTDDCGKFYVCDDGTPHLKSCQPGLHFNPKISACDYPKNAGCDKKISAKENGRVAKGKMDICPPENSEVPVHLAHPDDCGKFYVCDDGTPYLKSCQQGLHFNPKISACDYPKNAGCDKKVSAKENGRVAKEKMDICPPENSEVPVHLAHPDDCGKFYVCDDGTPHLKSCQPGLHFNPKINVCDYPKIAGCDKKVGVKGKGGISGEEFGTCPPENLNDPVYLTHSEDCGKFYVCDNGTPHLESCPVGLHFNPKVNACDYPKNAGCEKILQGVIIRSEENQRDDSLDSCPFQINGRPLFIPHSTECDKYYICEGGKKYPFSCPQGLYFNSKQEACDFPENADCERREFMLAGVSSPFCPPMDGKLPVFFRHSNDCNIYYMCGNGRAYEFSCPARLHFNLRKKVCDYEGNAKCKAVGS